MTRANEMVGITRFHRVTIGAGVFFCAMMVIHFARGWFASGDARYLWYGGIAILGGVSLLIYLVRFWRRGI